MMTPDLIALLGSVDALVPRERAVLHALGEADPTPLAAAVIADLTGAHLSGFGTALATLSARRFVERCDGPDGPRRPVYRLLPRGQAAYRDLEQLAAHTPRRSSRLPAGTAVGV